MKLFSVCVTLLALASTGAMGAVVMLEDFEAGNAFTGGTVVADPDDATNSVLYVDSGPIVLNLAQPLAAGEGVSIRVYDQGKSAMDNADGTGPADDSRPAGTKYGWNLGVSGTYNWGVALINKSFLGANGGYGWSSSYYDGFPQTASSIWSVDYFGGPRQADALSVIGTGSIAAPEVAGDGAWSTWVFTYNGDGSMTVSNDGVAENTQAADEAGISQIYIASRAGDSDLGGVWVDDVQIIPEPATMSLLGLGALALIRRRR